MALEHPLLGKHKLHKLNSLQLIAEIYLQSYYLFTFLCTFIPNQVLEFFNGKFERVLYLIFNLFHIAQKALWLSDHIA